MGNFFKKCLPPSNPYIEYVAPVNPVTTTAAPDYKYFLIPSSGTICPPHFLIQGNCNCGSLFISKNFGLNIDGNIVKFSHNQDVLLNNNQAFIATTDKLNIANINDIDINLFTNVVLKNKIQVIIKINETNQPIAYSVIGNDSQNYTINTINLCLQEPISLNNESLRIEFYSLCYSIDKNDCCDKLPSTITLVDTTTLLPCPTTTTTTTTTLPPFCSRFNLPNLFYATVTAGYPLDRQEKVSLFVRNGNTYSTTGIFPCGTNYTLSMTCDPITQKFYYDGFIDCCDQNTKSVVNETSRPLIVPGAVLPSIIFYENCENCNSICTSTTTSTTQYPDCCNWDGKNQYIEFSCNDQIYSLPFYKIGSNLFEASATLECGDTVRALYRCNSNIPYIDSTSCSQKWEPLSISVPCATNARLTGNVLEPCECDKPPVYEWVADDLSNCDCCGPPFDIDWELTWNGTLLGNPWIISNKEMSIRFNVEDSLNCGGNNVNTQSGTATATITVGNKNVLMDIDFVGIGELEASGFEEINFYINGNQIGSATSTGGSLECQMGPIIKTQQPQQQILLANQVYTFLINFSTNDHLYHVGSYYQVDLTFEEQL